jgi:hypothetical protein
MAELWKTTRRCSECLSKGVTNYLMAQAWGTDEEGTKMIKLNCPECEFTDYSVKWDGH